MTNNNIIGVDLVKKNICLSILARLVVCLRPLAKMRLILSHLWCTLFSFNKTVCDTM